MECIICDRKHENNILYENDRIIIMLAVEPSVSGHMQIFSKEHYTIMEQAPDDVLNYMISSANKISMILFELLKVHGTNMIINNGVPAGQKIPHFCVDILPRRTDDNLKLDWALKQAAPEALESIQRIINEGMNLRDLEVIEEKRVEPARTETRNMDTKKPDPDDDGQDEPVREKKTNYYHQLFERIP